MFTPVSPIARRRFPRHLGIVLMFPLLVRAVASTALMAAEKEATVSEPPAKISINPPQPEQLARGVVLIQYRTENAQIAPVFGPAAVAMSPRVAHLHVIVDEAPWRWADASGGPVIVNGLPPGPHKTVIELADANHQPLATEVVNFEVPAR